MVNRHSENLDSESVRKFIGHEIETVSLDDNALAIRFTNGRSIRMADMGHQCCENRYMSTDDDLSEFVGARLLGIEVRDAPSQTSADVYEDHDVSFLAVQTSKGEFVMKNHNEHNGYYGGFDIRVDVS